MTVELDKEEILKALNEKAEYFASKSEQAYDDWCKAGGSLYSPKLGEPDLEGRWSAYSYMATGIHHAIEVVESYKKKTVQGVREYEL